MTAEKQAPDRNLAMELVRVTEAAALAASRWMGRGDKEGVSTAPFGAGRLRGALAGLAPWANLCSPLRGLRGYVSRL